MARCKAITNKGTRCQNPAKEGSDYCHIPTHGESDVEEKSYWRFRNSHGRKPIYDNPKELWNDCVTYFEWIEDNPLKEEKAFHSNGEITKTDVTKMRAMTLKGLCLFLGIHEDTWRNYREKKDFFEVTARAEDIIYSQKFEGAAAGLLNSNIIARDIGLKDKKEVDLYDKRQAFDEDEDPENYVQSQLQGG